MEPTYKLGTSIIGKAALVVVLVSAIGGAIALAVTADAPAARTALAAPEVVRLDPVVVTISRDRYDELYADAHPASRNVASAR